MGRGRSALSYTTSTGVTRGIQFTERDEEILRQVVRWYAITAVQLYRYLNRHEKHLWHPAFGAPQDELFVRGSDSWNGAQRVRERLGKYRILDPKPQSGIGPFVDSVWISRSAEAWFALPLGARYAGLGEWVTKKHINDMVVHHANAAASIATQLESYGYRVASERELRRGRLIDGTELSADFTSVWRAPDTSTEVKKHPDLAILSPDGDRYIAVEIERSKYRSTDVFAEKLAAYARNPSIDSVWYLSVDNNTLQRVATAAARVFKDQPGARVRAISADDSMGFWHIPYFAVDDNPEGMHLPVLHEDLRALTEGSGRRGIVNERPPQRSGARPAQHVAAPQTNAGWGTEQAPFDPDAVLREWRDSGH